MHSSSHRLSRRSFLQHTGAAVLAFPFVSRLGAASANGMLRHASFGASGMAGADLNAITGTGTFGDMGCHIYDPVFNALALTAPVSVRSEGPAPGADSWAINAVIHYLFPGTPHTESDTIRVTWYDGDRRPPQSVAALLEGQELPGQGSVFIGTKGVMLLPHVDRPSLFPKADFADYQMPEISGANHWEQFVNACLGHGATSANFDYAGPLTETVLLGSLATRFPKQTLEWNSAQLTFTNVKEANTFVGRSYRKGWEPRWV